MRPVVLKAHAKINLDLRVLQRRPDGYHELRTVFQALELHDSVKIEITGRRPFALLGDAAAMPLDRTNLAWRAADALWTAAGRSGDPAGVRITIRKRIPARAGLGGGSSDAAAVLVGLNRLWRLRLPPARLLELAATLGSDVPFFLIGGLALAFGRGEELYPLVDPGPQPLVLVVPVEGVSTADAYGWLASARSARGGGPAGRPCDAAGYHDMVSGVGGVNDLQSPVEAAHPAIREAREQLTAAGAHLARMSGSGSALFGLFRSLPAARRAARALSRPGRTVLVTRTQPRGPAERRFIADRGEKGSG
jgi:4-diphosphocytidyl-2-C-methyl-D-erythritol kinase